MNRPNSPTVIAAVAAVLSLTASAQSPLLQQSTRGSVTDIQDSNLDLDVRFTYEIDPADLDRDRDQDLVLCQFYMFEPPLGTPGATSFTPIIGTGGIRIYENMTWDQGVSPGPFAGPPDPNGNPALNYDHMRGGLTDQTDVLVDWGPNGVPPSVRDAEIVDVNGDSRVDIVLSCGVGVDPAVVASIWSQPAFHIVQNRVLIQQPNGVFRDETYGTDQVPGGAPDRLPALVSNTCGVAVGDLDGDSHPDIVFGEYGPDFKGGHNIVLLNDGNGQGFFSAASPNPFIAQKPIPGAAADVELYDLDGNGTLDIVVANANPGRAPVIDQNWVFDPNAAEVRRNEVWINDGSLGLTLAVIPDPPGLPSQTANPPYNDRGFWNDTRSVSIGDIDRDGDGDILFANNGWRGGRPDMLTHEVANEVHGQAPQLLLNMGNAQLNTGPAGMQLNDFLDVASFSLPWGLDPALGGIDGGWRAFKDFELTPDGGTGPSNWRDVGRVSDLDLPFTPAQPNPDGYPDLAVAFGPWAANDVWINSGDWRVLQLPNNQWISSGRFFRGAQQMLPGWQSPPASDTVPWYNQQFFPFVNSTGDQWTGLGLNVNSRLYTHDIDWVDLDIDGRLDLVTADGDPRRGEINGVYFFRGLRRGFRWLGPSDDGAVLPNVNTVLSYGAHSHDLDGDNDLDIIVPGAPTALLLENQGGAQGGTPGQFKERTFFDSPIQGYLPFTGKNPLYAPILTETVAMFESGAGPAELPDLLFGGYPAYDSLGNAFGLTDAPHWHFQDPGYHDPVADPAPNPFTTVHCNFYVRQVSPGMFEDVTLLDDPANGIPWLDRNGRDLENISDRMRAADLDNNGALDVVTGYRPPILALHPHLTSFNVATADPNEWQIGLSLWMNDGAGHLRDEAIERLGDWNPGAAGDPWEEIRYDIIEAIAFGDVDSDGDLDMFTGNTDRNGGLATGRNHLWINMGGDQKDAGGGSWRTGEFRIANLVGSPMGNWGGMVGPSDADPHNSGSIETCDINGDDHIDFAITGRHDGVGASLLINQGDGTFLSSPFGGMVVDQRINVAYKTGDGEIHKAVAPGDFDGDGDTDVAAINSFGFVNRLYENKTSGGVIAFEDVTSVGTAPTVGSAKELGISWVPSWSQTIALADDFDGDGLHDLYVANHERTTQDDLYLSTAPDPTGPRITRIIPRNGVVTGGKLRILGANLANVDSVAFEQSGGANVLVTTGVVATASEVEVTMPANASIGTVRVFVGQSASYPAGRSNSLLTAHLNAAPRVTADTSWAPIVVFVVDDPDGPADVDPATLSITRTDAAGIKTTWAGAGLAAGGWSIAPLGNVHTVASTLVFAAMGDRFEVEIGDQLAAFGSGVQLY